MKLHESVSLCPECFAEVPATYEARGAEVWQSKSCAEHGSFASKVWDDVQHFSDALGLRDLVPACDPATGCCPTGADERRKCLAVVDVTDHCNLRCEYCFAGSAPDLPHTPREKVVARLATVLRESGGPTPIQLSGGEATTRDDLPEIIAHARSMGFDHIEVNSNGIRIAEEPGYAAKLKAAGASTVYLQFDGFGRKIHKTLRAAAGLHRVKDKAVRACREAGLSVILVPMVVPGVNEDQLGDIVRYGLRNLDVVRGINIQPVSHFGRHADDTGHLSLPAIHRLLAEQTGFFDANDLKQVPCCSPLCSSATMLLAMETQKGAEHAVPLTRFVSEEAYRDVVQSFEETRFMDLLAGRDEGVDAAKDAAACCGISVPEGLEKLLPRMLAVTVTGFMDADTVDVQRLNACCINVPTDDGQLMPFCAYNLTTRSGEYALRPGAKRGAPPNPAALPVVQ